MEPYHKLAVEAFNNLNEAQVIKLRRIARRARVFRIWINYIDSVILPTMYDYQLFTGSDYLPDSLKKLEKNTNERISQLNVEETLTLITSALAGGNPGAEYWYRKGITGNLFKHLVDLTKIR